MRGLLFIMPCAYVYISISYEKSQVKLPLIVLTLGSIHATIKASPRLAIPKVSTDRRGQFFFYESPRGQLTHTQKSYRAGSSNFCFNVAPMTTTLLANLFNKLLYFKFGASILSSFPLSSKNSARHKITLCGRFTVLYVRQRRL